MGVQVPSKLYFYYTCVNVLHSVTGINIRSCLLIVMSCWQMKLHNVQLHWEKIQI